MAVFIAANTVVSEYCIVCYHICYYKVIFETRGAQNFSRIWGPSQNSRCQKDDMKQVPH